MLTHRDSDCRSNRLSCYRVAHSRFTTPVKSLLTRNHAIGGAVIFVGQHQRSLDFVSEFMAVVNRGTYDRAIPHLASPYRFRH